jgi:pseudaminic acid biosynthesis-associated methylase
METTTPLSQWRGHFGDEYVDRNPVDEKRIRQSTALWAKILDRMAGDPPRSALVVGANVCVNLHCIRRLSDAELWAVEPNDRARSILIESTMVPHDHVFDATAQDIPMSAGYVDLTFAVGVLIHISPDDLLRSCSETHRCSRKYILCVEYFSDRPEENNYRGRSGLLFKRDFGSFYLDNFPDLELIGLRLCLEAHQRSRQRDVVAFS